MYCQLDLQTVLSTFLVLALLVMPVGASIASSALAHRIGANARWLDVIARISVLAAVWIVFAAQVRGPILGWSISSWTTTPIAIDSLVNRGGAAALIVYAASLLSTRHVTTDPQARLADLAALGLSMFGALLVCLASTASGVLIGGGILALATAWRALQISPAEVALRTLATHSLGVLMSAFMLHINIAQNASGFFTGMLTPGALTPLLTSLSALLLCGVPPFGPTREPMPRVQLAAGALIAFGILARSPRLETWAIALALIGALIWSMRALTAARPEAVDGFARHAALSLLLVASASGQAWMALMAWIALSTALDAPLPLRMLGLLIGAGLPLTVGFSAWSGAIAFLSAREAVDAALVVLVIGVSIICVFAVLRRLLPGAGLFKAIRKDAAGITAYPGEATVLAHAVLFGFVPSLAQAPAISASLSAMGVFGWTHVVLGTALGVTLWQLSERWLDMDAFDDIDTALDRLGIAVEPIRGAFGRLQRAMRTAFALLESDGALLWACLATIVAVLAGQAGAP